MRQIRSPLDGFRSPFGRTQGDTTPAVLTLVSDDLDQDPPVYSFDSTKAGTLRWDFHSSATPPAAGAGDIATGTQAAVAGQNDIELALSAYEGETGYLHFRIGASNILTSQVITVPFDYADYVNLRAANPGQNMFENGANISVTGYSPQELGYFDGATITATGGNVNGGGGAPFSQIAMTNGVPVNLSFLFKTGTSGKAKMFMSTNGGNRGGVSGDVGSLSVTETSAGAVTNFSQTSLGDDNWQVDFTVTPNATGTFDLLLGPFTNTAGETVVWLGYRVS